MNIVVWEWELDQTLFVPYSPEVSCFLENAFKTNKDIVDIGQADPSLSYEVSLKNMTQTRLETGMSIVLFYSFVGLQKIISYGREFPD